MQDNILKNKIYIKIQNKIYMTFRTKSQWNLQWKSKQNEIDKKKPKGNSHLNSKRNLQNKIYKEIQNKAFEKFTTEFKKISTWIFWLWYEHSRAGAELCNKVVLGSNHIPNPHIFREKQIFYSVVLFQRPGGWSLEKCSSTFCELS